MEVRRGYKVTEVGVIPEEWDSVPAGSIGKFRGGNGFPLEWQGNSVGDYPFFKVSDMNNEGNEIFMENSNNWISELIRKQIGANVFPEGSIVFAKVGAAVFLERKKILCRPSCIDNNMAAYVIDERQANSRFIHAQLLCKKFGSLVATTALPALNGRQLAEIPFALPPLPEQLAIAKAMSDIDELLVTLDRLIVKKRDLKKAAMKELLTGKLRLPDFSGKWEVKRLGDIGVFLKGSGVRKDEAQSGDLPCVRYGELYTHHKDYIRSFNSWISTSVASAATRLVPGDLLFAGSGETKEEIGKCVAFVQNCEAYAGGDIVILRTPNTSPLFMGYYCNDPSIVKQKASKGQGDAVVHISAAALASIEVTLPSVDEQTAIAAVLSDMDAEIEALEARRAKTRDMKQAMMQELLTGRIRLVQPEAAHA